MKGSIVHKLKILLEYFKEVKDGNKTFEIRFNDRDFQCGEILMFEEYDKKKGYTGAWVAEEITYVLNDEKYMKPGYVALEMKEIEV